MEAGGVVFLDYKQQWPTPLSAGGLGSAVEVAFGVVIGEADRRLLILGFFEAGFEGGHEVFHGFGV